MMLKTVLGIVLGDGLTGLRRAQRKKKQQKEGIKTEGDKTNEPVVPCPIGASTKALRLFLRSNVHAER